MAKSIPATNHPLRMSTASFRARQGAGETAIVLDVRNPKEWDRSDAKLPGALRAYPEFQVDPSWPRDRLILAY